MIVTLDNQRVETQAQDGATLGDVVQQVRAEHDDCLIVSVSVNGTPLSDADLEQTLAQPISPETQVDLETGDPRALTRDALRGLAIEFKNVGQKHPEIADRLGSNEASVGVQEVGQVIQLWQTSFRVFGQCSGLLGDDLTQWPYEGQPIQAWFEEVVGKLVEVREALEARDMVLLADLVRYEMPPLCDQWRTLLYDLADRVATPAES